MDYFFPLPLLFEFLSQLDKEVLWLILIVSFGFNFYYFKQNKKLHGLLKNSQEKLKTHSKPKDVLPEAEDEFSIDEDEIIFQEEEGELLKQTEVVSQHSSKDSSQYEEAGPSITDKQNNLLHSLMQSFSGWHQSLVPFLFQNIGWFIGILCFISGSIFFISYTEGFNKSITIFYTVLSYTLLLAFGGYRLKTKVSHASISGIVLMATSFLLIPLNFLAAVHLLSSSSGTFQYSISGISTLLALVALYSISQLVSGIFNRQLLKYFSPVFFALSMTQFIVLWMENNQSLFVLIIVQMMIVAVLLWALIAYMPALLKQVFVERQYLLLMSVGSLIYTAIISILHISLSSPLSIPLSYYAPAILLISAALFYIDGQLNDYKQQLSLLNRFSIVSYVISLLALSLSLENELIRNITFVIAIIIYARLIWLYRSLAPMYLVIALVSFLHFELILSDALLLIPGITSITQYVWYYFASLPLIGIFSMMLLFLRRSELQMDKHFDLTYHLFHLVMIASIGLNIISQFSSAMTNLDMSVLNLLNTLIILVSCYYWLTSKKIKSIDLLGNSPVYTFYLYALLILPVVQLLFGFQHLLSLDFKLLLITALIFSYSLNSRSHFITFFRTADEEKLNVINKPLNSSLFINTSIILSVLILVLISTDFSLSIKIAALIFVLSLNFLLLSFSLLNRALFYVFLILISVSILMVKLYLNHASSTGLLLVFCTFLLFYFIHWLETGRNQEREASQLRKKIQSNPEMILWFYPINDYCVKESLQEEVVLVEDPTTNESLSSGSTREEF
ncbi:MAG: hypothetical protein GY694_17795 [Gammaproteobacteria bacterium]|nr:hypothetical protein [Gammaproteobacteria bacterium]